MIGPGELSMENCSREGEEQLYGNRHSHILVQAVISVDSLVSSMDERIF